MMPHMTSISDIWQLTFKVLTIWTMTHMSVCLFCGLHLYLGDFHSRGMCHPALDPPLELTVIMREFMAWIKINPDHTLSI